MNMNMNILTFLTWRDCPKYSGLGT